MKQTKILSLLLSFQPEERHIDKIIKKHIDCTYQSFHKIRKALSGCEPIPGEAGSNDPRP